MIYFIKIECISSFLKKILQVVSLDLIELTLQHIEFLKMHFLQNLAIILSNL